MSDQAGGAVLIVTREAPPAVGPHPIRVAKLAKYLPEFGWRVTIVTVPESHAWAIDETHVDDMNRAHVIRIARLLASLVPPMDAATVRLAGEPQPQRTTEDRSLSRLKREAARLLIPDRDVLWALPAARAVRRLTSGFDVVLTTAPPFSTHLVGGWLALTRDRTPWIAEYRDNWTMNPLYRRHGIRASVERQLEAALVRRAAGIVVISNAAADEMLAAFPRAQGRVHVVANGFDPDDLPTPGARARAFEIVYTGSLDIRRDPRPLLVALGRLVTEDEEFGVDLRLRLIGNVAPWVHEAARRELGNERVISAGLLSHRDALAHAAKAAVLLVITTQRESGAAGMTSKLPEYLGLRRPVLMLAPPGPGRELVVRLHAGEAAEPDDVEGIRTAIVQLHHDWKTAQERIADQESLGRLTRRESARQMARVLDSARLRRHST